MPKKDRTGEKRMQKCGYTATIICYRKAIDIDLQFDDELNSIRAHCEYSDFKAGKVGTHHYRKKGDIRVGQTNLMNCGVKATIINYRSANDIDVQFDDKEHSVRKHCTYRNFAVGGIAIQTNYEKGTMRFGQTKTMHCGLKATIVNYVAYDNIDIKFENGYLKKHCSYSGFCQGTLRPPYCLKVGEKAVMNCGFSATVVKYVRYDDIDVKFENGSLKKHTTYKDFCKKHLLPPTYLGMVRRMKNGHTATIVWEAKLKKQKNGLHLRIRFDNGMERMLPSISKFVNGLVDLPNAVQIEKTDRINIIKTANNGFRMRSIDYINAERVIVQFEDGSTVTRSWAVFASGAVGYPFVKQCAKKRKCLYGFKWMSKSFSKGNQVFYNVINSEGERMVLTPQMMMQKAGIKPVF